MDIQAAATRKLGPLPVWAWGAVVGVGALAYRSLRGGGAGGASSGVQATVAGDGATYDPGTTGGSASGDGSGSIDVNGALANWWEHSPPPPWYQPPIAQNGGPQTPPPTPAPNPAPKTYTVKRGDTLSAIAARLLGSGARWKDLYALNKSVIGKNPSLIKPGQVLRIPAK